MALTKDTFQQQRLITYAVEAGDLDTSGYAEIVFDTAVASGDTAVSAGTYDLSVAIDGAAASDIDIVVDASNTFADVITDINNVLTGATASLTDGNIRITSDSEGASSTIVLAEGDGSAANGGFLAALTTASNTNSLGTPVDGTEGQIKIDIDSANPDTTQDFYFVGQVRTSSDIDKSGIKFSYDNSTGYLTVADDGSTTELATGDVVTVVGVLSY